MSHYECMALCKHVSLQWGQFCARSQASCIPRSSEDRSSRMFFIQVVRGRPGGRLQFSGGDLKMALLASAISSIHTRCLKKVRRWDLMMDESGGKSGFINTPPHYCCCSWELRCCFVWHGYYWHFGPVRLILYISCTHTSVCHGAVYLPVMVKLQIKIRSCLLNLTSSGTESELSSMKSQSQISENPQVIILWTLKCKMSVKSRISWWNKFTQPSHLWLRSHGAKTKGRTMGRC